MAPKSSHHGGDKGQEKQATGLDCFAQEAPQGLNHHRDHHRLDGMSILVQRGRVFCLNVATRSERMWPPVLGQCGHQV